jgi:predicted secreted hydrolase
VKKRYKKKKKNNDKLIIFLIFACLLGIFYWGYLEVYQPKYAQQWSETKAENKSKVNFPEDEGLHSNEMEWWYYNGHLETESGKKYSFHLTTFVVNNVMSHTVFHGSLSDHQQGKHYIDQIRLGGKPSLATKEGFKFKQGNWLVQGSNGHDRITMNNKHFTLDLSLESTQAPILQGDNGIILLKGDESSYYYSRTRMKAIGTLQIDGFEESVTGISWFDHQWGDFSTVNLSWDWFSLQLDDGIDLMIYQIRDNNGNPIRYEGSYTQQGRTEILKNADFIVTPLSEWTSKKTSIIYPVSWNIKIPKKNINLNLKSIVNQSEFDSKLTTYNIYWEGAISVDGSHTGKGFIELNGTRKKAPKTTN